MILQLWLPALLASSTRTMIDNVTIHSGMARSTGTRCLATIGVTLALLSFLFARRHFETGVGHHFEISSARLAHSITNVFGCM